jgi:hypothetical protein
VRPHQVVSWGRNILYSFFALVLIASVASARAAIYDLPPTKITTPSIIGSVPGASANAVRVIPGTDWSAKPSAFTREPQSSRCAAGTWISTSVREKFVPTWGFPAIEYANPPPPRPLATGKGTQVHPAISNVLPISSINLVGSGSGNIENAKDNFGEFFSFSAISFCCVGDSVRGANRASNVTISPRWIELIQPSVPNTRTVNKVSTASDPRSNSQPRCCFSFGNRSPSQYTPTMTPTVAATYATKNKSFATSSGAIRLVDSIVAIGFP